MVHALRALHSRSLAVSKERDAVPVNRAEEVKVAVKLCNGCVVFVVKGKVKDRGILNDARWIDRLGKNYRPTLHTPLDCDLRHRLIVLLGDGDELRKLEHTRVAGLLEVTGAKR